MGVIQRQSIKNILVNYVSVGIGAVSTIVVYPMNLDLYGSIQFWVSTATLLSALMSLGSYTLVSKYFPFFKKNKVSGFLNLVLLYALGSVALITSLLWLLQAPILEYFASSSIEFNKINDYIHIIYPIACFLVFQAIFRGQSANFQRVVIPDLITVFGIRVFMPILILLGTYSYISANEASYILVAFYATTTLALFVYVRILKGYKFSFDFISKLPFKKHKEMCTYMLFGALNHIGSIITYKIDIIMIGLIINPVSVGYYAIFLFISTVIEVPSKAIIAITSPLVSKSFEQGEMDEVNRLYKRTSNNLFVAGVLIFGLIWMNLESLFSLMVNGENLIVLQSIFVFLGLTRIIDMTTALNFSITSYSKHFRYNILFISLLSVLNISLNIYFIEAKGVIGAAIATGISMFIFNIVKTLFVYFKFGMHPFNKKMILPLLLLITVIFGLPCLPKFNSFILDGAFRSILFLGTALSILYFGNVSVEANALMKKILKR